MWIHNLSFALFFLSAALIAAVLIHAVVAYRVVRSLPLVLLMCCALLYTVSAFVDLMHQDLSVMRVTAQINACVASFAPVFWVVFAREYLAHKIEPRQLIMMSVVPIVSCVAIITMRWHSLYYGNMHIVMSAIGAYTKSDYGPLFYLNTVHACALAIMGMAMLLRRALGAGRLVRVQVYRMLLACVLPALGGLLYISGAFRMFDPTVIALGAASVLVLPVLTRSAALQSLLPVREAAVDTLHDAWIAVDSDLLFMDANLSAQQLFPALKYLPLASEIGADILPQDVLQAPVGQEQMEIELPLLGENRTFRVSVSGIDYLSVSVGKTILLSDITQMAEYRMQLMGQASTDYLTKLFNRRGFTELASRELARLERSGGQMCVISMDIDHFKNINDAYGHVTGDHVLCLMSNLFAARLRKNDVFARFGGEEFVILLPDTKQSNAIALAERLRNALAAQDMCSAGGQHFRVTASFGVACMTRDGMTNIEELIEAADAAMYRAKQTGRNRVCVYEDCPSEPGISRAEEL